ncbi:hypothetical protein J6590_045427 [Homalodisca vitripennis]|nr:hypothetical protein J6590_045427 [Homalodisca vitripennis]
MYFRHSLPNMTTLIINNIVLNENNEKGHWPSRFLIIGVTEETEDKLRYHFTSFYYYEVKSKSKRCKRLCAVRRVVCLYVPLQYTHDCRGPRSGNNGSCAYVCVGTSQLVSRAEASHWFLTSQFSFFLFMKKTGENRAGQECRLDLAPAETRDPRARQNLPLGSGVAYCDSGVSVGITDNTRSGQTSDRDRSGSTFISTVSGAACGVTRPVSTAGYDLSYHLAICLSIPLSTQTRPRLLNSLNNSYERL